MCVCTHIFQYCPLGVLECIPANQGMTEQEMGVHRHMCIFVYAHMHRASTHLPHGPCLHLHTPTSGKLFQNNDKHPICPRTQQGSRIARGRPTDGSIFSVLCPALTRLGSDFLDVL